MVNNRLIGGGEGSYTSPLSQNRENQPFVDWLTVSQTHTDDVKIWGKDLVIKAAIDTGELKTQTVTGAHHEGSFESKLIIRSDGRRVTVSGNPSRFNQPHNVCGLSSLGDCIALYNNVLTAVGLPAFVDNGVLGKFSDGTAYADRPKISRIDLTQNYAVGAGNVPSVIRWLATQKHQRSVGHVYGNGATVDWGRGSRSVYMKYYDKSHELSLHNKTGIHDELIAYLKTVGLLRHEVSLKSTQLIRLGLDNIKNWTHSIMKEQIEKYAFHKRVSGTRNTLHDIAATLVELGTNKNLANRCQSTAIAWASGVSFVPGADLSKSAFYRLRKPLLTVGIDISIPANVCTLPISVREIEITEFALPEKYACIY